MTIYKQSRLCTPKRKKASKWKLPKQKMMIGKRMTSQGLKRQVTRLVRQEIYASVDDKFYTTTISILKTGIFGKDRFGTLLTKGDLVTQRKVDKVTLKGIGIKYIFNHTAVSEKLPPTMWAKVFLVETTTDTDPFNNWFKSISATNPEGFGSIATRAEDAGGVPRYINTSNNKILLSKTIGVDNVNRGTGQVTLVGSMYKSINKSMSFKLNVATMTAASISKDIYAIAYLLQLKTS